MAEGYAIRTVLVKLLAKDQTRKDTLNAKLAQKLCQFSDLLCEID